MSSTNAEEAADNALLKKLDSLKMGSGDGSPKEEEQKGKTGGRRHRKRDTRSDAERMREWEENQEKKNQNVIETGLKGTVKWYSVRGHYGFIACDDDKKGDIFVHQSAIWKSPTEKFYLRSLADNQSVEFNLVQGDKGLEATRVTGPDGCEVKEAPGQMYRRGYRPLRYRYRKDKVNNGENGESKRPLSKSEGNGDGAADEGKSGKARRRPRPRKFRRAPKGAEEKGGDQEGSAGPRRRRGKSESAKSAASAEGRADSGQESAEVDSPVDTKA